MTGHGGLLELTRLQWRARLQGHPRQRRASEGEVRLQLKWPAGVRRKRVTQSIDLRLHLQLWPGPRASLQDTHVPGKVILGVSVELWVWGCDSHLVIIVSQIQ